MEAEQRAKRDAAIVREFRANKSDVDVFVGLARKYQLTQTRVRQIVNRDVLRRSRKGDAKRHARKTS